MRWTRGAGGSAAVAVVALGVWGASVVWVSICDGPEPIRPLIDDPLGQLRVFTARCCGRSTDRAPPAVGRCGGTAGSDSPAYNQGSTRSRSASVRIRSSVCSSSIGCPDSRAVLTTTHRHRPRRWPPVQSGASQLAGGALALVLSASASFSTRRISAPCSVTAAFFAVASFQLCSGWCGCFLLSGVDLGLLTTITDPTHAPAAVLAKAYHQRWEHESGSDQLKTHLRGPAKILRLKSRTPSARKSTATC